MTMTNQAAWVGGVTKRNVWRSFWSVAGRATLLAAVVLAWALPAQADAPNLFQPEEMASGAITAAVVACIESSVDSMPTWLPVTRERYCSCAADAARIEYRRSPTEFMPTWEQLRTCATWASAAYTFDGRTPFNHGPLNSRAIALMELSCWRTNDLEPAAEVVYCGCRIDAIRNRGDRPMVTAEEDAFCRGAAEQVVTTGTYPLPLLASSLLFPDVAVSSRSTASTTTTAGETRPRAQRRAPDAPSYGYGYPCAENGSCYGDISGQTGNPRTVHVQGYHRRDGTYVRGHYRSRPR